jgi:hypothetical protein
MSTARTAALGLALLLSGAAPVAAQDPAPKSQSAKIDALVEQLGSNSYEEREAAQRELEAIGRPAVPALQAATKSKDLEVASRAADALAKIQGKGPRTQERQPRDEERAPAPGMRPMPQPLDLDDVFKDMEGQLPEGFGKILRRMFQDAFPGQPGQPGQPSQPQDEERKGDAFRPRVRTWTWNLTPGQTPQDGLSNKLGLTTGPTSAVLRAQLELEGGEGRVVNRLVPGGYATANGIQLYDVIISLNGRPVRRTLDLSPLLEKGGKLQLLRKAKVVTLALPKAEPRPKGKAPPPKQADEAKPGRGKQRSF